MRTDYDGFNQGSNEYDFWLDTVIDKEKVDIQNSVESTSSNNKIVYNSVESSNDINNSIHNSLTDMYIALYGINKGKSQEVKYVQANSNNYIPVNNVKPKKNKKKKRGLMVGIILGVVVVSVAGVLIFLSLSRGNETDAKSDISLESTIDNKYEKRVLSLYKDDKKSDINDSVTLDDINNLRSEIEMDNDKDMYSSILDELSTIELYIKAVGTLNKYTDETVNLELSVIDSDCNNIKNGTDYYCVDGLKETILGKVDNFIAERDEYFSLKRELLGISDIKKFDDSLYDDRVDNVSHTINKNYLLTLIDKLNADKKVSEAEEWYVTAKDKIKAKKELDDIKESQRDVENRLSTLESDLKKDEKSNSVTEK